MPKTNIRHPCLISNKLMKLATPSVSSGHMTFIFSSKNFALEMKNFKVYS